MALDLAFSIADYAIFGIMLFISFGIGVYHASKSSKNNEEFVMGSRSFSVLPMAISLCASFNSAYMILGIPGEIYSHGTQFYIMILGTGFGVFIAAELWLPILYRIQVVSIYEYFELRYKSKFPRILMTLIFILKVCFSLRSSVCRDQFEWSLHWTILSKQDSKELSPRSLHKMLLKLCTSQFSKYSKHSIV